MLKPEIQAILLIPRSTWPQNLRILIRSRLEVGVAVAEHQPSSDVQTLPERVGGQRRRRDGLEETDIDVHRLQHLRQLARAVGHGIFLEERLHLCSAPRRARATHTHRGGGGGQGLEKQGKLKALHACTCLEGGNGLAGWLPYDSYT